MVANLFRVSQQLRFQRVACKVQHVLAVSMRQCHMGA